MNRLLVRVGASLVTLLLAVTITFVLARTTGDPVRGMLGLDASAEQVDALRAQLGLDASLPAQYLTFLGDLFTGDLGTSFQYDRSNLDLILGRLPASIQLVSTAILLAVLIGTPLGIAAAVKENTVWDRLASTLALLGQSIPLFWLGLMLVLLFSVNLKLLPAGQSGTPMHLILPAITLSLLPMAQIARLTRASMVETLHEPHVVAARARGLSTWRVVGVHALRSAALPVVTIIGLQAGTLLSGAVTIEYVFAWPGLGSLATQAIRFNDFSLVQAVVVTGAVIFVLINLAVDACYGIIDPRIRDAVR